jgi:hypothetical protein
MEYYLLARNSWKMVWSHSKRIKTDVGLFNFGTPDGQYFNLQLGKHLNDCIPNLRILHFSFPRYITYTEKQNSNPEIEFSSHAEVLEHIFGALSLYDEEIKLGVANDYRRNANPENITNWKLDHLTLENIKRHIESAKAFAQNLDIAIIPDVAYAFEFALRKYMVSAGKKVILFNAGGHLVDLSDAQQYPANDLTPRELNHWLRFNSLKEKEMAGDLVKKPPKDSSDSIPKLSHHARTHSYCKKNVSVLFLHCFRDACAFLPYSGPHYSVEKGAFLEFVDWTEYMFLKISQNPAGWKIKVHPDAYTYPDEIEILDGLKDKYRLPSSLFENCPTREEILEFRMKCFTFSGTIALELASHGFKAICMSDYHPRELVQYVGSKEALDLAINQNYVFQVEPELAETSSYILKLVKPSEESYGLVHDFSLQRNDIFESDAHRGIEALKKLRLFKVFLKSTKPQKRLRSDAQFIQSILTGYSSNLDQLVKRKLEVHYALDLELSP